MGVGLVAEVSGRSRPSESELFTCSRTWSGEIDSATILPRPTLGQSEEPRTWALFTDTRALGGGFEGRKREHTRNQEEVVENGVYLAVVGVAAARTVQTAGDAGLPEMGGVVARVALGETDAEVLRIAAGEGLEMMLDHLDEDRKSTRLNSSHVAISYAVFCLKKK